MGDNLISGKFISTFQIPTQELYPPISPKMTVQGSHSTINYESQPVIQEGDEIGDITDALVCSLDNYDLFLEMSDLTTYNALIDYGNSLISFPKKGITPTCKDGNNARFSAPTNSDTPDFIS